MLETSQFGENPGWDRSFEVVIIQVQEFYSLCKNKNKNKNKSKHKDKNKHKCT